MKIKKVLLPLFAILVLASCNKEEEVYEKKDVKVDSVFDKIEEGSSDEKKEEEDKKDQEEKKEEKPQENKEENQPEADANKNNNNENNNDQDQAVQTRQTTGLVNMRETPTANAENFILSVPQGRQVEFIEEVYQGDISWSKVRYQGSEGFIRSDLLR